MGRTFEVLQSFAASRPARWVGVPLLVAAALASVIGQSQTAPPPTVSLAAEPLYARGARAKPTLTLALSVEFPTVGAQYVSTPNTNTDNSYAPTTEYIGYYDAGSCYLYNNGATAAERYYYRTGAATNRTCGGAGFSGNFLNWSTSSAIDVLRYGLTGGDRVVDTSSLTVLQRAVLPAGRFYGDNNFPSKILSSTYATGAVPDTLRNGHTGDIYITNCLNRMHYGTAAKTGTCAAPGNDSNLGVPSGGAAVGVVTDFTGPLPSDFSAACAAENGTCAFAGRREVAYGAGNNWKFMVDDDGTPCTNAVFGDPINGTVKACYTRATTPSTPGLTSDQFFYTRVRVCESNGSGTLLDPRASLCLRYPNGNYKPVGNLQKYSDRVRVAAFGYLNDSPADPQRYGGVLRAPMKYVGPKYFNENFALQSGSNPAQEWDESTGVLVANPDGQTSINSGANSSNPNGRLSGVINYLNQFGRHGTFGQYKTYDSVGEMYYEAIRYIQGLPPTDIDTTVGGSAIYNITDTMRDGFPVYTSWTDPHPAVAGMTDYSCVKNNVVGIGDVNTHNDRRIPGNPATRTGKGDAARAASTSGNMPDFHFWTKVVGGFESNNGVTYTDGKGVSRTTSNPNTPVTSLWGMENTNIGADNASYYMAGVAYWANTHDIRGTDWSETAKRRPGMRVTTYWLDVNEYGQQTNPDVHRTRNQFYMAAKYGGFKDVTGTGNPFKSYTAGTTTVVDSNENWERASADANKREAKNYFLSSSATEVLAALDEIFAAIAAEANSIAGGAISTQRLTTSGGVIYQAQFDPADWSGDLVAYPVGVSASSVVSIGASVDSPWRNAANQPVGAAGKLDDMDIDTRKIYVGYNTSAGVFGTTEFKWNSLNTVTQEALRMPPYAVSPPLDAASTGQARLDYLRGDRSNEATGLFRRRGNRLGDIVNSGVAFSGAPSQRYSDSSYAEFYDDHKDRTKALFVGANDGMLHAFNADTGAELFAYIPSWLVPKLPALTSSAYAHASYADGSPAVTEAKVGDDWKTVLVSGTGGGGQGVFALDVSNPDVFGDDQVMWEFTDRDDVEMGNVIGHPKILKVNVGAGTTTPNFKYFAVFASGVNNYADDGRRQACSGDGYCGAPALFLLDLNKAKSAAWELGTNYYKIRFPVKDATIASGLSEFAVRLGGADELAYVYAGDLQGNVWKLDFTTNGPNNPLSTLSFFKDGSEPIPLYVAKDAAGNRQPITMEPALVFGSNRTIIVSFGTGKYLEMSDNSGPFKAQSVYSVLDNLRSTPDTTSSPQAAIAGRGRLAGATTVTAGVIDVPTFVWGRPETDTETTKAGWYFDFFNSDTVVPSPPGRAGTGERQVSGMSVLAGKLIFGTVIPAVNSCDNGQGNLYIVDVMKGDAQVQVSTVGILGEPFVAQVGASTLSGSDTTGRRRETTRYQIILQGSAGLAAPPGMGLDVIGYPGRLSWREISNYQELKNGS
jgi:type IV pilus assembly protein PilY1